MKKEKSSNAINSAQNNHSGEWKEVKLEEVAEVKYGKAHQALADGDIPAYGSGGLMRFVEKPLYEDESILIPRKGTLNNIIYKNEPFWTVDTMFYTKLDKEKVFPKFLFYQLSIVDFANMNVGSAVPSMTVQVLNDLDISLPPLPEQQAIAEVLSSLDDKIDLLHRQNKTLEQLAETLFRKWFIEEAEESWEEKGLDEIAEFINGLACQKFPRKSGETGLPVIKIKEMRTGITESSDWATADVPEKYIIENGDMLFSWSGSLDIVLWFGGKGVLNQHLFKVSSDYYPQWFYYFWTQFHLQEFKGIADDKATTMGHIQRHHLSDARVVVPTKVELQKMDETVNPLFQKIKSNTAQIRTLTQLRDTLLPKLMSGEVRVNY